MIVFITRCSTQDKEDIKMKKRTSRIISLMVVIIMIVTACAIADDPVKTEDTKVISNTVEIEVLEAEEEEAVTATEDEAVPVQAEEEPVAAAQEEVVVIEEATEPEAVEEEATEQEVIAVEAAEEEQSEEAITLYTLMATPEVKPDQKSIVLSGTVEWNDKDNAYGTRPASVTVTVLADGKATDHTATAGAASGWSYVVDDLPRYDSESGSEISYNVRAQAVDGYSVSEDVYTLKAHELTIVYFQDGMVRNIYSNTYYYGQSYEVASEEIVGYQPDAQCVAGTMEDYDMELFIAYNAIEYTLTIHFMDAKDGHCLNNNEVYTYRYGEAYSVVPRVFETYKPILGEVSGIMPAGDRDITLCYVKNSSNSYSTVTIVDNFNTPLGLNNVYMTAGDCAE